MERRHLVLAALLVAVGAAALTIGLSRIGGDPSGVRGSSHPTVSINAPATTPEWLLHLASRKARAIAHSAPTTGVIVKRRLTYEVRLHGNFTWLACDPCARSGPLPVAIQHSIVFRVNPADHRVVMASGPSSLMR